MIMLRFTIGGRKICSTIKKSQNIMNMIIGSLQAQILFLTSWQKQALVDVLQTSCSKKFFSIIMGKHLRWSLYYIKLQV